MANPKSVAMITGAGRGIGMSIALALAQAGYDIIGIDIEADQKDPQSGLFRTKASAESMGSRFLALRGDVADIRGHQDFILKGMKTFGQIDLFVSNAGVAPIKRLDLLETTPESYDRVMAVNSRGPFFLAQQVARLMLKQMEKKTNAGNPALIFITSISAVVSSVSRAEYCISKAALSHTATLFADRLAGKIAVYEIRPGIIETDMTAPVKEKYDRLIQEGLVPQNRWGHPDDIARAVVSLAGGDFRFATGSIFEISGGMQIRRL